MTFHFLLRSVERGGWSHVRWRSFVSLIYCKLWWLLTRLGVVLPPAARNSDFIQEEEAPASQAPGLAKQQNPTSCRISYEHLLLWVELCPSKIRMLKS